MCRKAFCLKVPLFSPDKCLQIFIISSMTLSCNIRFKMSTKEEKLHVKIRENNQEEVKLFLNEGVNVNCIYYGMTPLLVAVGKGKLINMFSF